MCREIGPWKLIINCLYAADEPITFNDSFWEYISLASERIKERFPKVEIFNDHYSIESVIQERSTFIKVDNINNTLMIDSSKCQKECLDTVVNYSFDNDMKEEIPTLIKELYRNYVGR